jgi:hypothetical protein
MIPLDGTFFRATCLMVLHRFCVRSDTVYINLNLPRSGLLEPCDAPDLRVAVRRTTVRLSSQAGDHDVLV